MKKISFLPQAALSLLVIASAAFAPAHAQKTMQQVDASIADFAEKFGPERAYLHYDKQAYSPGETIWFKAYVMNEVLPAIESKSFYTDVLDEKGNLLQHITSPMVDGVTNGQFEIPLDYKGQFVFFRAYTRWMLNFDSAFLFTKQIRVLGNDPKTAAARPQTIATLQFFPEGGDAIVGQPTKIAFKANDQWGKPVKIKGTITDAQGKFVDSLRPLHNGMGFFMLIPDGSTYTANWKDEKEVGHTTKLPAAKTSGASLQVQVAGTTRRFQVNYSADIAKANDSLHIIGTMYQHEVFRVSKATAGSEVKGAVPTQNLPTGLLTFTVFDKNWAPLAERVSFINNEDLIFKPEFEVQHWGLNKRARNEIKITLPDSLVGSLSIAVTDEAIGKDTSRNIVSHLLLSSEIRGDVYNASHYFTSNDELMSQKLDLVMLTHGWRRFKWDEVLSGKTPKPLFAKDTSYMTLSGTVFGAIPGQIPPGAAVVLMLKQKKSEGQVLLVPIESNGTINERSVIIFDTAQIYYQFQNKDLKNATLQFMTDRLQPPTVRKTVGRFGFAILADTLGNYRQWLMANESNDIAEKNKIKTLENVIVKSKTKSPVQVLDEKYASGLFSGGDGYQFDLVNDPFAKSAIDIFTYLQGKVAGLQISGNGSNTTLTWRQGTPALYLDEMNSDVQMVSSISVQDVAYIKVFRPPFMGGFNGGNGAIAIYTRRGNDVRNEPGKGLANNKVEGYTAIREFYSPNYSSFNQENEQRDLRSTLYWNPNIEMTSRKPVVLTFYNNDVTKAFRVIIEGMTRDGRLAHYEEIME
ncbi:hypothetical protein LZZ85_02420 [Terrimonas sp. NA20]|uniref:Macroglobulin domain-containing protein n=1 Tax=Terrimonas ginsenosidimutans TaxID=2908004 RepID=A0ABS9KLC1_9BACT|nr:hypothetical protein [Terrimonas ginsenosidimutans]MCG2613109.1 hypothetical protein [Terrimonas ginsenosidimutans]